MLQEIQSLINGIDPEVIRSLFEKYGYFTLFFGAFFDGLHAMVIGGFLAAIDYLRILPTFFALLMGDFLSDLVWFYMAYFGGIKVVGAASRLHKGIPAQVERAKDLLENHTAKMILIAKLTFGIGIATMLAAGLSKMSAKKFIFFDLLGNALLTIAFLILGYVFGESYEAINRYLRFLGVALLIVLASGVIIFEYWNRKRQNIS